MDYKQNKLITFVLLCVCCWTVSCNRAGVRYEGFTSSAVQNQIENDMDKWLRKMPDCNQLEYTCKVDKQITDGSFGYEVKGNQVNLIGGDEIGISHAFYTLLEDLGYTFDMTGVSEPVIPKDIKQLSRKMITPKVRWRGIRQHVNFPMDISSYSIEDAKEYVRSLLRMRLNKLVIHSYPGQWYETHLGDSLALAGNFFYGNVHYIYDNAWLKKKVPSNDSIYCIPAAEPVFGDPAKRSHLAVEWMRELIDYASDLGFYVQFSFEPRLATVEQAVRTAEEIVSTYPQLDALEMITEETGGWGPRCTADEVRNTLDIYFPDEIAHDSVVCAPIRDKQSDLNALYSQIGIIVKTIEALQGKGTCKQELKLGIYSSITDYTKGAYRLARLALPETQICLMPSHGSDGTADAISELIHSKEDLSHTEIYSWIEFDGLMYVYQNSINGNARLMEHIEKIFPGEEQYGSLLYNHWRTAENRTSARFAMESVLKGVLQPVSFYQEYAERLGITDVEKYKTALELVNQADSYSKEHLGNIGFCWVGAWRSGGAYTWMRKEQIQEARGYYMKAGEILSVLLRQQKEGTVAFDYLSFIGNRVLCSVIYLDAFITLSDLQTIQKKGNTSLSGSDRAYAEEMFTRAFRLFDQYMEIHAQKLQDRGCEGTLVSIWNAPIRGLRKFRAKLLNVAMDELPHHEAVDAPPLPIFYEQIAINK